MLTRGFYVAVRKKFKEERYSTDVDEFLGISGSCHDYTVVLFVG